MTDMTPQPMTCAPTDKPILLWDERLGEWVVGQFFNGFWIAAHMSRPGRVAMLSLEPTRWTYLPEKPIKPIQAPESKLVH